MLEPILPDPPDLLPTCLERIHYPVFDPQNPNHNPAAAIALPRSPPPRRHDLQVSSSESQRQGSWLEEFPRRSIHKARSGLLAIRASLLRLSSRENTDFSEAIIQDMSSEASRRERDHVRGHGHSNSTQEDLSFGVCLFRTSTSPWATTLDGADSNLVPRVESPLSLPLVNSISAPAELESYYYNNNTDDDPEPMNDRPVSMASEEPPSYRSIAESARYHRHSNDSNPRGNTNRELGTDTSNETHGCLTQPSPSVDWDELGSPASSFRYEDMIPCQRKKVSRFLGTGSSLSSSPISVVTQSETLFSQEHLPPNRDQPKNDYCGREDLTPTPSPPSEMVTIAFPGVYQALLDQWAGEMRDKSKNIPCAPLKIPECNPVAIAQARQTDGGEAEPSGKRHSFGLHMSLRTVSHLGIFSPLGSSNDFSRTRDSVKDPMRSTDKTRWCFRRTHMRLQSPPIVTTHLHPMAERSSLCTKDQNTPTTPFQALRRQISPRHHIILTIFGVHWNLPWTKNFYSHPSLETSTTWPMERRAASIPTKTTSPPLK